MATLKVCFWFKPLQRLPWLIQLHLQYRFDLGDVFFSHSYSPNDSDDSSLSFGLKGHVARAQADLHQVFIPFAVDAGSPFD